MKTKLLAGWLIICLCSCKKEKTSDPFSGVFALKNNIPTSTTQYLNPGASNVVTYGTVKYFWKIQKAVDDKYYISSADLPGKVVGSDGSGEVRFVTKSASPDDSQLFQFKASGNNDNMYYLLLASNPNKYISCQGTFGGAYFLAKDAPCVPGICFFQKFTLVP